MTRSMSIGGVILVSTSKPEPADVIDLAASSGGAAPGRFHRTRGASVRWREFRACWPHKRLITRYHATRLRPGPKPRPAVIRLDGAEQAGRLRAISWVYNTA